MATKKNTAVLRGDKEYNYFRITRTVGQRNTEEADETEKKLRLL